MDTAKDDKGKLKLSLVPGQVIRDIALVREYGCEKYHDPENWRKVELRRYIDAFYRHWVSFVEDNNSVDEESGIFSKNSIISAVTSSAVRSVVSSSSVSGSSITSVKRLLYTTLSPGFTLLLLTVLRPLSITLSLYHACIYLSRVFAKLFQDFLQLVRLPCVSRAFRPALILPGLRCTRGGLRRVLRAGVSAVSTLEK